MDIHSKETRSYNMSRIKPETIVLKESDYIDYEQNHILISTFIRSLLINHTFVFLGYSLNDYNLNLIIGWINYFKKLYGVKERPHNFLIDSKTPSDFERIRLESKNIFVIDLSQIPDNLIEKAAVPEVLSEPVGKRLYTYLKCIKESQLLQSIIPLGELLTEKYKVLKSYKRISFRDLIRVQPLGGLSFMGSQLVLYDAEWYMEICKLIDEGDQDIINTFQRAGIISIESSPEDNSKDIPCVEHDIFDNYFQLYLDNNYLALDKQLQGCQDTAVVIHYYNLLGKSIGYKKEHPWCLAYPTLNPNFFFSEEFDRFHPLFMITNDKVFYNVDNVNISELLFENELQTLVLQICGKASEYNIYPNMLQCADSYLGIKSCKYYLNKSCDGHINKETDLPPIEMDTNGNIVNGCLLEVFLNIIGTSIKEISVGNIHGNYNLKRIIDELKKVYYQKK